jgi:hypothetical protein
MHIRRSITTAAAAAPFTLLKTSRTFLRTPRAPAWDGAERQVERVDLAERTDRANHVVRILRAHTVGSNDTSAAA